MPSAICSTGGFVNFPLSISNTTTKSNPFIHSSYHRHHHPLLLPQHVGNQGIAPINNCFTFFNFVVVVVIVVVAVTSR